MLLQDLYIAISIQSYVHVNIPTIFIALYESYAPLSFQGYIARNI